MTDLRLLLDSPDEPRSRIQVATLGDFTHGKYGDFSITADDINAWKQNLQHLPGGRALIDLDHRADRSPRNSEAAGWITDLALEDGVPFAEVEWTPVGKQAIQDKRYLFFSPTFGRWENERGDVFENTLTGGALTNKPHLSSMPTVSLAAPERVSKAFEDDLYQLDVDAAERKLAVKEGNALPDGSYPIRNTAQLHAAAILAASGHGNAAAAKVLIRRRAKELGVDLNSLPGFGSETADSRSKKKMASVTENTLKLLDLDGDADDAAVEAAVAKLLEKPETPEVKALEAEVKDRDAQIKTLETKVGSLEQFHAKMLEEIADREFTAAFDKSLREGRVVDAQRDKMRRFFELDQEAALDHLQTTPQLVRMGPSGWNNERVSPEAAVAPAGVDADSFQLDQKVRAYIQANNLNLAKDYPKVLNQALSGGISL